MDTQSITHNDAILLNFSVSVKIEHRIMQMQLCNNAK